MRRLALAAVLVSVFASQASASSPVQVECEAKGSAKKLCNWIKSAINQSVNWHQTKKGVRYVMIVSVEPNGSLMGATLMVGAKLGEPVSNKFPVSILLFSHANTSSAMLADQSIGPAAVLLLDLGRIVFEAFVADLNAVGSSTLEGPYIIQGLEGIEELKETLRQQGVILKD